MKSQLLKQGLGQTIGQTLANQTIWKIWQNTGIRPQRWKLNYMPNGIYKTQSTWQEAGYGTH